MATQRGWSRGSGHSTEPTSSSSGEEKEEEEEDEDDDDGGGGGGALVFCFFLWTQSLLAERSAE